MVLCSTFNLGANINIDNICGVNNHHIIESCYKALALSLRKAIDIDARKNGAIPSTKNYCNVCLQYL